jgi:ribosome-binding factor A
MTSRRVQKAAEAIREVVGMAILRDLKDPRVRHVTVTFVEVSPDLRQAKVHVSIMGTETEQHLCLRGLQSAAGFLQSKLAANIDMRYTPRLQFVIDQGVKRSIEVMRILQQLRPAETADDNAELDNAELDDAGVGEVDDSLEGSDAEEEDAGAYSAEIVDDLTAEQGDESDPSPPDVRRPR